MTDREIYARVRAEALAVVGVVFPLHFVLYMVDELAKVHADEFTIDGAQDALTQMIRFALILKDELRKGEDADANA